MNKLHLIEIAGLILIATAFFSYLSMGGWYSPSQPLLTSFNTTFWNLDQNYPPLNFTADFRGNDTVSGSLLLTFDLSYNSNYYGNGSIVRIHSILIKPAEILGPPSISLPGVLLLHGTNGSAQEMLPYGEEIASHGYIVLAMDSPGCGNSTGPACTDTNNIDFSNGPYSSYYYYNVLAAYRSITVLTLLNGVDANSIAVTGASMGGIATFIISAIDQRVDVAIPIVAAGYFDEIITQGSYANIVIPVNVSINDPRIIDFGTYFDCRAYASQLKIPTLMLIGTDDQFFFLDAVNKTYADIASEDALSLAPNQGHALANGWLNSSLVWMDHYLKGNDLTLPAMAVPQTSLINFYTAVNVSVPLDNNYSTSVYYRYMMPGSLWSEVNLNAGETIPLIPLPTYVSYFTAAKVNGTIVSTSPVYQIQATSSIFYVIILLLLLLMAVLAMNWRAEISAYVTSDITGSLLLAMALVIWLVAAISITLPWLAIPGRATLSLMQIWSFYAISLPPVYLIFLGILVALAAFAIRMWLGGLVLAAMAVGLYAWLASVIATSAGYLTFSWGAFLMGACVAIALVVPALMKIVRA